MSRCGCAGNCSCTFSAGRGVRLSGEGTTAIPVRVDGAAPTYMVGSATETVQVELEGSGTADDPFLVHADAFAGAARPLTYVFSVAGSYVWTRPTFGTFLRATVIGAGGGGGGGLCTNGAYDPDFLFLYAGVGYGGEAGSSVMTEALLADLGAAVPITVGAGGSGGAGITLAGPFLSSGSTGALSSFNGFRAPGGEGGAILGPGLASVAPPTARPGVGGRGGAAALTTPPAAGGNGGARAGQAPVGGAGGSLAGHFSDGGPGGTTPQLLAPYGTGGGGGVGMLVSPSAILSIGGGNGGKGGPGAGGGGGGMYGAVGVVGPSGGAGGDGIVVLLVQ